MTDDYARRLETLAATILHIYPHTASMADAIPWALSHAAAIMAEAERLAKERETVDVPDRHRQCQEEIDRLRAQLLSQITTLTAENNRLRAENTALKAANLILQCSRCKATMIFKRLSDTDLDVICCNCNQNALKEQVLVLRPQLVNVVAFVRDVFGPKYNKQLADAEQALAATETKA